MQIFLSSEDSQLMVEINFYLRFKNIVLFNVLRAEKLLEKSVREAIIILTNVINGARLHLYYLLMNNFIAPGQKKMQVK